MKRAIPLLAVLLYQSAAAQQTDSPATKELSAYHPVKFETLKKFKQSGQTNSINTFTGPRLFVPAQPERPAYNFKTLLDYLSDDTRYFRLEQKKKEWTQFSSGLLNSWQKKQWLDNKNNIQQRWMAQKTKGR